MREHFPDLPPSTGPISYARNYLEKLIQVPFRIPALGARRDPRLRHAAPRRERAGLRTIRASCGFSRRARQDMRRPWKSRGLDRRTVEAGDAGTCRRRSIRRSSSARQVTKILSEGTRGNPRQIKRFLNSMMLRHAIAEERGFGADIQRPVLAKIMLAERFYPDFYEQIARLAAAARRRQARGGTPLRGTCPHAAGGRRGGTCHRRTDAEQTAEPRRASRGCEWDKNEWAKGWAAIDPPLADVDLRPYVFVTR